jgi:hypothetical protein
LSKTPEHNKNNSEAHKGLQVGEKNGMYGKKGKDSPNYGQKRTPEQKRSSVILKRNGGERKRKSNLE